MEQEVLSPPLMVRIFIQIHKGRGDILPQQQIALGPFQVGILELIIDRNTGRKFTSSLFVVPVEHKDCPPQEEVLCHVVLWLFNRPVHVLQSFGVHSQIHINQASVVEKVAVLPHFQASVDYVQHIIDAFLLKLICGSPSIYQAYLLRNLECFISVLWTLNK